MWDHDTGPLILCSVELEQVASREGCDWPVEMVGRAGELQKGL